MNEAQYKGNNIIEISGKRYRYTPEALGAGENGTVHLLREIDAAEKEVGEELVLKMQYGRVGTQLVNGKEETCLEAADANSAEAEHTVAATYNPDGRGPLGVAVADLSLDDPESELFKHALGDNFVAIAAEAGFVGGLNCKPIYLLIQRRMPGNPLGKVEKPLVVPEKVSLEEVYHLLLRSIRIAAAVNIFHEQTKYWHMDIRPENILEDKGGNIRLIDTGAAGNYKVYEAAGETPDYSHPDIIDGIKKNAGFALEMKGDNAYSSKHEAYSVRQVLEFIGLEQAIKNLSKEDQAKFKAVTDMFALSKDEIDMEKIKAALQSDAPQQAERAVNTEGTLPTYDKLKKRSTVDSTATADSGLNIIAPGSKDPQFASSARFKKDKDGYWVDVNKDKKPE